MPIRPHNHRRRCPVCREVFKARNRVTCSIECRDRYAKMCGGPRKRKHQHDFLPADAHENVDGHWVPSPDEIAAGCRLFSPMAAVEPPKPKVTRRTPAGLSLTHARKRAAVYAAAASSGQRVGDLIDELLRG